MKQLLTPHAGIKPAEFMRTRGNLRLAEKEYVRIYELLNRIELGFGKELGEDMSDDAFNAYNQKWIDTCNFILRTIKPKCWGVDFKYFYNVYKNREI